MAEPRFGKQCKDDSSCRHMGNPKPKSAMQEQDAPGRSKPDKAEAKKSPKGGKPGKYGPRNN